MSSKNVSLQVKSVWCNKATESGKGDIYFVVGGKKSDGSIIQTRIPETGVYSLSDHGGTNDQQLEVKYDTVPVLWSGSLNEGESIVLNIAILAGDQGDADTALNVAKQMADQTDTDVAAGTSLDILESAETLVNNNTDDFPGSFAVKITNKNGNVTDDWQSRDRCIDRGGDVNGRTFHFAGDSSIYYATFNIS